MNILAEYGSKIAEQAYAPREYLERQLNMTDEEKQDRAVFFEEFFKTHEGGEHHTA